MIYRFNIKLKCIEFNLLESEFNKNQVFKNTINHPQITHMVSYIEYGTQLFIELIYKGKFS